MGVLEKASTRNGEFLGLRVDWKTIHWDKEEIRMHRNESETMRDNNGETMHMMRLGRVVERL